MQIKLGLAFNYHFQIIGNFFCFSIVCDIYNLQIRSTWWHAEQHVVHVSFETATVALASARGVPSFYEAPANPSGKTKPSENFIFNLVYRHGKDGASLPGASLTRTEFVERSVDRPDACARNVRFRGNSALGAEASGPCEVSAFEYPPILLVTSKKVMIPYSPPDWILQFKHSDSHVLRLFLSLCVIV